MTHAIAFTAFIALFAYWLQETGWAAARCAESEIQHIRRYRGATSARMVKNV